MPVSGIRHSTASNMLNGLIQAVLLALEKRLAQLRENPRAPELRDEFEQTNKFRRE
jgi:hypothetical protein